MSSAGGGSWTLTPATISNPTISYTSVAPIAGTTITTLSGTGSLVIGTHTVVTGDAGKYVLLTDQTDSTQNGLYTVTSVSSAGGGTWTLTSAVASNPTISYTSSAAITVTTVAKVYSGTGSIVIGGNWLNFAAVGQAAANLPLEIVFVTSTGTEIVIGNDLQDALEQVTIGDLKAFYTGLNTLSGSLNNAVVSAATTGVGSHGALLYGSFAAFKPLTFNFNLTTYFAAGGSNSVVFTYVPDLFDSYVSPSIIAAFQNAFYVGDALDLALFTIQSSIAEALAQEFPLVGTSLSGEAEFVEEFRSQFTTLVRQNILASPNFPLQDIRNAIFTAGVNLGLLSNFIPATGTTPTAVTPASIVVNVMNGSVATLFPFGSFSNTSYYGTNSDGTLYETVPGSTTSITFAFNLTEDYSSSYTTTLSSIDLGDSSIGATITTNTEDYNNPSTATAGGIVLQRKFVLNLGFGIDANAGFFIFNPTEATGSNLKPEPIVDFGFIAELSGNISDTTTVSPFFQNTYSSQVNSLSVEVADGRIIDQLENESISGTTITNLNGSTNDNLPSGFYGDVLFDLNFNHDLTTASGSLSFLNGRYADVEDLRSMNELGSDATYPSGTDARTDTPTSPATEPSGTSGALFNFVINADADVDLMLQSQNQGLIPATQADLIYSKSYGIGAVGFGLIFNNSAVVGLGNATLGAREIADQNTTQTSTDTTAVTNAVNDFTAIDSQVSPIWRFANPRHRHQPSSGQRRRGQHLHRLPEHQAQPYRLPGQHPQ